tara:strand:- start:2602 stop:2850 length:249 start_codon:yes stop_codon:yes gene_type:complete
MEQVFLINNLPLPLDITKKITNIYKHIELTPKYKRDHKDLINHLQYYMWLTIKLKKRDNPNQTLNQTIKEFDYYRPKPNYSK